jgi:beta-barrel assembly-enhancing protease
MNSRSWSAGAVALAVALTGCSAKRLQKAQIAVAGAVVSDEQEEQLGLQVREELTSKQNVRFLEDPAITAYVESIAKRILPQAGRDRPNVRWRMYVVDDPKTVNAFATPGGHLYVYSGLLLTAENEAEVAGVLAHEAGHVVGRHSARQMVGAYGLQAVTQAALGKNPSDLHKMAAAIASNGALLAYGRSEETEADEYGVRYSATAGYDPRGLVSFFEKLRAKESGNSDALAAWFSSHPATGERIAHLQKIIGDYKLQGTDTGADRLAAVKAKLKARYNPPPPAPAAPVKPAPSPVKPAPKPRPS